MTAARLLGALGLVGIVVLLVLAPVPALAGWRACFLVAEAVPAGAVALLLVARVTGADWRAPLAPLTRPLPFLLLAFLPVVAGQALGPGTGEHRIWLSWPFFGARGLAALAFWWWLSRRLLGRGLSVLGAGLALAAHGIAVTLIGTDWLLGAVPGQPNSAIGMILGVMQIGAACAAALVLGTAEEQHRQDFAKLAFAAALGLSYLFFMDFLIVWYGDLPSRVAFYAVREDWPWAGIPALAVLVALCGTLAPALARGGWIAAGAGLLAALLLVSGWQVAGGQGWLGLLATAVAAIAPAALLREVRR